MPEVVEAAPKKIILCCDGTWQSSVSGQVNLPSNITRIARTIAKAGRDGDKVWQQLVYYDAGVGTGALSTIESNRQGATGDGLVINVLEAYNFVVNNYSPGDKIYCFGFSRGAFTARAIAGMITDFGVIKPDKMQHFASLLAVYKKNTKKYNFRKTKEYFDWLKGKPAWVAESKKETEYKEIPWYDTGIQNIAGDIEYPDSRSVELVGVFDTVGSLGLADTYVRNHASSRQQYEWLNVKWNPYIKHAFHALALDDRREPFLPTLYYIPKDQVIAKEDEELKADEVDWPELTQHRKEVDEELQNAKKAIGDEPDLVQVWFTGVHINVGGGTDDVKADFEGLANITFAWMLEQCRPYLAFDEFTNATLANYSQRMTEYSDIQSAQANVGIKDKAFTAINETGKWLGSFFSSDTLEEKMVRSYCRIAGNCPEYRIPHWTLFPNQDSYTPLFKAISSPQYRTPGACVDRSTELRSPLEKLGKTNEWIHPSVQWRIKKSHEYKDPTHLYDPKSLEGFKYEKMGGVYGWKHKNNNGGTLWIPEWPITAAVKDVDTSVYNENAEMALVEQCKDHDEVRKFLKEHATAWNIVYPKVK